MTQKPKISPESSPLENCLDSKPLNISSTSEHVEKYRISSSAQNWFGAVDCCNYHGLRLATVNDEQDHASINRMVEAWAGFNATGSDLWIGASDLARGNGDHVWQATGQSVTFSKWLDNEEWDETRHCVEMNYNPDAEWHWSWKLEDCGRKLYFACELVVKVLEAELVEV
uniref:Putative galactose-specific c-type lectin n=1 Tax=Culex tarsalis TaxID=7177 RepID=A0A1Q3FTA8_CULTA